MELNSGFELLSFNPEFEFYVRTLRLDPKLSVQGFLWPNRNKTVCSEVLTSLLADSPSSLEKGPLSTCQPVCIAYASLSELLTTCSVYLQKQIAMLQIGHEASNGVQTRRCGASNSRATELHDSLFTVSCNTFLFSSEGAFEQDGGVQATFSMPLSALVKLCRCIEILLVEFTVHEHLFPNRQKLQSNELPFATDCGCMTVL